jgi:hypothetical protein
MSEQQQIDFKLESAVVSECTDDGVWDGDGVVHLDESEVAEMTKGDEKPFHVEFVALYEGLSNNKRKYGKEAIETCVDAMVGVNMYKGHIEPGTSGWKYREPVGRIVAAKIDKINIDGKETLAAKGKAYISEADPKLRDDIKRKMAGNVSILGNARIVRQYGDSHKTVTKMHKPLKSVDFCNPGSGGLSQAGVTAVVSEMEAKVSDSEPLQEIEVQMVKLTKEELLSDYKPEITALVGEQVEEQVQEIAAGRRELAEQRVAFDDEKKALDESVQEMTQARDAAVTERDDWKSKFEQERDARIASDLSVFKNEHVAEMTEQDGAKAKLFQVAAKRVNPTVVEGDFDKSKQAFIENFSKAVEEVSELAEMFAGPSEDVSDAPKKLHDRNPVAQGSTSQKLEDILSPELRKSRESRSNA